MNAIATLKWVRHASVVLLSLTAMASKPVVAQTAGQGSWGAVLEWEFWIAVRDPADPYNNEILFPTSWNQDKLPGEGNLEPEISHAAVIPSGPYAGWILLWRKEMTFPGLFGHPRSRGLREDVRHGTKRTTEVHG